MSNNNKIYVTSDTHFGHRRVLEFEPKHRPFNSIEEHDRSLVERWNATVRECDTIWHLGDVFFGKNNHEILAHLNGVKKLILGNHDQAPLEIYQKYFTKIYGAFVWGRAILTHIPVHSSQLEFRFKKNIHGHMHSKKLEDPRYICVSVEQTDLKPVLLQHVVQHGL